MYCGNIDSTRQCLQAVDQLGLLLDGDRFDVLVLVGIRGGEIFTAGNLGLAVGDDLGYEVGVRSLRDLLEVLKGLVGHLEFLARHLLEDLDRLVPGKCLGVGPDLLVFRLRVEENGYGVLGNIRDISSIDSGVAVTSDESLVSLGIKIGAKAEEEVVEAAGDDVGPLKASLLNLLLDLGLVGEEWICRVSPVAREV